MDRLLRCELSHRIRRDERAQYNEGHLGGKLSGAV
jgi:hypothetical protein